MFSDQNVREYVETQINLVWDKLESDVEAFLPFFKAFGMHSKIADRTVFFGGKFRKRKMLFQTAPFPKKEWCNLFL